MRYDGDVTIGVEVFTTDGDRLGMASEVQGRYFKVDAPMQPDYWLDFDTIANRMGDRITLMFHHDRLGDYQLRDPRAA